MRDKFNSEKGSTLLVVVIIMSIVIMMGSIMFNYSLQNLRIIKEVGNIDKAKNAAQAGLYDGIEGICDQIDQGIVMGSLGSYTQNNGNLFVEDPYYSYLATVTESGYDLAQYQVTPNQKSYTIKKGDENMGAGTADAVLFSAIAIESIGMYKTSEVREKVLIDIIDTVEEDGNFIIVIYNCYE